MQHGKSATWKKHNVNKANKQQQQKIKEIVTRVKYGKKCASCTIIMHYSAKMDDPSVDGPSYTGEKNYPELKESIKMKKYQWSDKERNQLIEDGKRTNIDEIITQNERIDNDF